MTGSWVFESNWLFRPSAKRIARFEFVDEVIPKDLGSPFALPGTRAVNSLGRVINESLNYACDRTTFTQSGKQARGGVVNFECNLHA